ncbi:MAG TPA: alpha/beta hydrolase [Candidatus Saccharimonadales bacterium]|nr:alpha/beta hydrolase [Candidatus Saccharimonadales bacterium]
MNKILDRFWHKTLRRPYTLTVRTNAGQGTPVILLHGLGSSSDVWANVVAGLDKNKFKVIAIDLLGFGKSPKPDWVEYDVDDHATSVAATIKKLHLREPAIIVGHSMGCLVTVRLARKYPELAKHEILYEMPLYEGLPDKKIYQLRLNIYRRLYQRIIEFEPAYDPEDAKFIQKLGVKITGFKITPETWLPYIKSLQYTVLNQTASDDIKHIDIPMEVIYGYRDMFVIRGEPVEIFGEDIGLNIKSHTVNAAHNISEKSAVFLCKRITEANSNNFTKKLAKKSLQA